MRKICILSLLLCNSSLIEISSGQWVVCFLFPLPSPPTTLFCSLGQREREWEFLLPLMSDQMFKLGQFLQGKKSTIITCDCYHRSYLLFQVFLCLSLPPSFVLYNVFHYNPKEILGWYSVNTGRKYVYFKTGRQFCINVFRKKTKW